MTATANPPSVAARGLHEITREIARGGLAGVITGVLVAGIGGRLAMRLSGLIDPSSRGDMTDAGAIVGEFTLEGTLGLVLFAGVGAGLLLAVLWVVIRPWMPTSGWYRYGATALVTVAMGARFAIEGRNIDFLILDPKPAQVAIFIGLALIAGVALVAIDRWLERRLPSGRGRIEWIYALLTMLGVFFGFAGLALFFVADACNCAAPPRLAGLFVVATGAVTVASWVSQLRYGRVPGALATAGRIALGLMIVAGFAHLGGEILYFT